MSRKPYYVKFETPQEFVNSTLELIRKARSSGKIRVGVNEVTKSIERGLAKLVVIAEDVDPPEIVAHIPILCKEKHVPFLYVPSKTVLGESSGLSVAASSISVVEPGDVREALEGLIADLKKRIK